MLEMVRLYSEQEARTSDHLIGNPRSIPHISRTSLHFGGVVSASPEPDPAFSPFFFFFFFNAILSFISLGCSFHPVELRFPRHSVTMATPPQASPSLHVLIVGGSVAGLTLANALSRANVNFTLLESKADPWADNASGAALTLLPNGCRILDQLGLFEDICKVAEPLHSHRTWLEDGSLLREIDLNRIKSRRRAPILCESIPEANTA